MTRIIADACSNHLHDRRIMEAMVAAAADARIDVLKWQSFDHRKLNPQWKDYHNAKAYYASLQLSEDDHRFIIDTCAKYGVEPLFTAFDVDAVDLLAKVGMRQVKVASPDATNWTLIQKCLDTFEHSIISTGMSSERELYDLLNMLASFRHLDRVTILHCVSQYPTPPDAVNMAEMMKIREYGFAYGWSDHTLGLEASKLAIALGADVVERHYTLSRNLPGKDHHVSSTPEEFAELVEWRDKVATMMQKRERSLANRHYIARWTG